MDEAPALFPAKDWSSYIDTAKGQKFVGWVSPPSREIQDAIVEVFANDMKVTQVAATDPRPDVVQRLNREGFGFVVDLELPEIADKLNDEDKVHLRYPGGGKLIGPNSIIVRKRVEPMTSISRDEIDAKLDASSARMEATEARMDAKLSQIGGDFNRIASDIAQTITALRADMAQTTTALRADIAVVNARLETVPRVGGMIITAISAVGVILAVLAFGGDRFDGGVQITSASVEAALDAKSTADETAKKVEELRRSVEALTKAVNNSTSLATDPRPPPG
ncbi:MULTISPECIES: hypothetical protein [Rhizobium/Agrobacterium group]|uniref:hypothetical protein n=1 Tax=Rhizobium/Agrobacterium group TaxID=227290 RepID=UPI001572F846|nr:MULTISPECIES: hypothetical protein [Rhizobium/Agrobacterium group]MCF1446614.1 hypothetical protein [Allorhizobium ampelinum]NSZ53460.1 hypothetical protein [Agrobacterium vitis]NTA32219.1 hypothetical protein [Agrobacterium vitis]